MRACTGNPHGCLITSTPNYKYNCAGGDKEKSGGHRESSTPCVARAPHCPGYRTGGRGDGVGADAVRQVVRGEGAVHSAELITPVSLLAATALNYNDTLITITQEEKEKKAMDGRENMIMMLLTRACYANPHVHWGVEAPVIVSRCTYNPLQLCNSAACSGKWPQY